MVIKRNLPRSWWGPRWVGRKYGNDNLTPTDPDDLIPPVGTIILSEDGFVLEEDGYILVEGI